MGLYLGIDAGTQSMKGIIIDPETGKHTEPVSVHFGRELPQYRSPDGFLPNDDPAIRHADPAMWLDALDLLLGKMRGKGLPMEKVCGISGSGQQHGTVYLNGRFPELLSGLKREKSLSEQLIPSLSRKTAPIWMDSSTGKECSRLREKFGETIRQRTGSGAVERFSGPQIMKFASEHPEEWENTRTVHLVSSFLASVFAGESMPIDYGDGAGMNLLDLNTLDWDREIADFTAPDLLRKLPPCVPSCQTPGNLSPYFAKYGLRPGIPVNVWSGDNPNSLVGSGGSAPGRAVISLGTSDTFFGSIGSFEEAPRNYGHVFGNPAGGFMTLICFTNGSLTRDAFRRKYGFSFAEFDAAAESAEPGKYQLLPFLLPESTPFVPEPEIRCNFDREKVSDGVMIRALLESQILSMRLHSEMKQLPGRIRLTGGASASQVLRQIIANVFQAEAETAGSAETAALGAAMRAANAAEGIPFDVLTEKFCTVGETVHPDRSLAGVYDKALERFRCLLYGK